MTKITQLEWHAIRLEFESLCRRIVHDGRDPQLVADAMMQSLARRVDDLQRLWDTAKGDEHAV